MEGYSTPTRRPLSKISSVFIKSCVIREAPAAVLARSLPAFFCFADEAASFRPNLPACPICSSAETCSCKLSLSNSPSLPTSSCSPDDAALSFSELRLCTICSSAERRSGNLILSNPPSLPTSSCSASFWCSDEAMSCTSKLALVEAEPHRRTAHVILLRYPFALLIRMRRGYRNCEPAQFAPQ